MPRSGPPRLRASLDEAVARRARYQHGLVTSTQLLQLGVTESAVRARLRRRQWTNPQRGVFRIAGIPATWESSLLTPILSIGGHAMASHRSAAALFDLDGFRNPGLLEVVVPAAKHPRRDGATIHRSRDLHLVEAAKPKGIPATPIGRTLLDLGAVVRREDVLLAVDDARRRELIDWAGLLTTLETHARRGRDGVGTLRSILDEHSGEIATIDSGFERLVMLLLTESGLPKPELQHQVSVAGQNYRIDLAYPQRRVAIELDGQIHLHREVWENDRVREVNLTNAGWHVLRFTWRTYRDDPAFIVRAVRQALKARERDT